MKYLAQSNKRFSSGLLAVVAVTGLFCFALTGCDSKKAQEESSDKKAALPAETQIKQIQDNPHMPPEAKEAAIRALQQNQSTAALRQAPKK